MSSKAQSDTSIFDISSNSTLAIRLVLLFSIFLPHFLILAARPLEGQTYTVIHNFTNGAGGASPWTGLTTAASGSFYGTTFSAGVHGDGIVFNLRHSGSGWIFTPLYSFAGGMDGVNPWGKVAVAIDGSLYGSTYLGGIGSCYGLGCGTVFHLTPSLTAPKTALSPWNETVLYRFTGLSDGGNPQGDLTFDQAGDVYGTATQDGSGAGVVYQLTPLGDNWVETVLYSPTGDSSLNGGVILDRSGNLYGEDCGGDVYELSPSATGWKAQILYSFNGGSDGQCPYGGLIMDGSGNLYGSTIESGDGEGGTIFELTPGNGGWTLHLLYSLTYTGTGQFPGPWDRLVMDAAGNLYGTAHLGGEYGIGSVFKLTPSNGAWSYTSLHDFTGGNDGGYPKSNLVLDAEGNFYGTASTGGTYGQGVIFEITP